LALSPPQIERYHRQLILPGWGGAGQERIGAALVTVHGDGPAARAAARYLTGAGVGRLRVATGDEAIEELRSLNALLAIEPLARPARAAGPARIEAAGALFVAGDDRAATGAALAGEVLKALLGLPHRLRVEVPVPPGDEARLPRAVLAQIYEHAEAGYPAEVCGLVFAPRGGPADEVRRCHNRQDELHTRDPQRHPRTAATGFALGLDDVTLLDRSLAGPRPCCLVYHSHVDASAYFSDEDRRVAAPPGLGPVYPELDHLVVDARREGARGARRYRFSAGDFRLIAEYSPW